MFCTITKSNYKKTKEMWCNNAYVLLMMSLWILLFRLHGHLEELLEEKPT